MTARVLIIGGYGNFGGYIARALAADPEMTLLVGGRSEEKARRFAERLDAANRPEGHRIDIRADVAADLARIKPDIVIHTTGPFQTQAHEVARACLAHGCHYVDLADARDFVATIGELDAEARARDLLLIAGASSVPCLTAAVIDHYRPGFARLDSVDYGISAAQQTNRGLATASAILSYVGRPFRALKDGKPRRVFGWQGVHSEIYPELGRRWFGHCDIPDLALFPARYPELRDLRFAAGHEIASLHFGTWLLSWLVRLRLLPRLDRHAGLLLRLSFLFDPLGSSRSGFHMYLLGVDLAGKPRAVRFFMIARSGHGPYIPCMPAILLARKLARGTLAKRGAMPCLDLIGLDEYLGALDGLDISIYRED